MRYGTRLRWTLALVPLWVAVAGCPRPPEDLDGFLTYQMERARVPGMAACIVKDGAVAWSGTYGWADVEAGAPVSDETYFMLASVSKTVTATAVMQLHERGLLDLDDPVAGYLPFPVANPDHPQQAITARMLLSHTSSIQDNVPLIQALYVEGDSPIPLGKFLREYLVPGGRYYWEDMSYYRKYGPGEDVNYSNVAMALAGYLVEVVSGMPFDAYCEENIFEPLGMEEASWFLAGLDVSRVAVPHRYMPARRGYVRFEHYGYPDYPDGQLRATARAYARFLAAILGGGEVDGVRILEEETVAEMLRIQNPDLDERQALCWYTLKVGGRRALGHTGGDRGVTTEVFFLPEERVGVILFTNGQIRTLRSGAFRAMADRLLEEALDL